MEHDIFFVREKSPQSILNCHSSSCC